MSDPGETLTGDNFEVVRNFLAAARDAEVATENVASCRSQLTTLQGQIRTGEASVGDRYDDFLVATAEPEGLWELDEKRDLLANLENAMSGSVGQVIVLHDPNVTRDEFTVGVIKSEAIETVFSGAENSGYLYHRDHLLLDTEKFLGYNKDKGRVTLNDGAIEVSKYQLWRAQLPDGDETKQKDGDNRAPFTIAVGNDAARKYFVDIKNDAAFYRYCNLLDLAIDIPDEIQAALKVNAGSIGAQLIENLQRGYVDYVAYREPDIKATGYSAEECIRIAIESLLGKLSTAHSDT